MCMIGVLGCADNVHMEEWGVSSRSGGQLKKWVSSRSGGLAQEVGVSSRSGGQLKKWGSAQEVGVSSRSGGQTSRYPHINSSTASNSLNHYETEVYT